MKKLGARTAAEPTGSASGSMAGDAWFRAMVGLIATIAVFSALYFARSVFAPAAGALFVIAIVWPIQSRLQAHMPKLLALAVVVLAIVVAFTGFATLVAWSFGRVGRWLVADAARFQQLYAQAAAWLEPGMAWRRCGPSISTCAG